MIDERGGIPRNEKPEKTKEKKQIINGQKEKKR